MKPNLARTPVLLVFACSCCIVAGFPDEQKLAAANNAFAFKLLKQLVKEQPGRNIFISPYSASTVLQMVASGAAGRTKLEMDDVLGIAGLSVDAVSRANQETARLLHDDSTNVILTAANAIWYRRDAPVNPEFIARNQEFFGATVAPLDFADPHSVDAINSWASEKTHGRITHIADGMIEPVSTRLFLANAVYFNGRWADPFDAKETKDRPFHLRGGGEKSNRMMNQSKTFTYRRGSGFQAVRLPYEGYDLAMYVFLPDTNSSPEKLVGIMNGDNWQRVTKPGFSDREGALVLPKFKLEYDVEFNRPLMALGMKTPFDPDKADFSGIAPLLYISDARQKTFVEVMEEGTEAAAVTGVGVAELGLYEPAPNPFQMIVDRPFVFLIEDSRTGTILFMGVVFDPAAD